MSFAFPLSYALICILSALAVEERARQLQMKVHSYRPSASHSPETDLKTKREVGVRFPPQLFLLLFIRNELTLRPTLLLLISSSDVRGTET